MHAKNITDPRLLEAFYLAKIFKVIESFQQANKSYAGEILFMKFMAFKWISASFPVWQEAFQNGQGQLSKDAIVHVWKVEDWQNITHQVLSKKPFEN